MGQGQGQSSHAAACHDKLGPPRKFVKVKATSMSIDFERVSEIEKKAGAGRGRRQEKTRDSCRRKQQHEARQCQRSVKSEERVRGRAGREGRHVACFKTNSKNILKQVCNGSEVRKECDASAERRSERERERGGNRVAEKLLRTGCPSGRQPWRGKLPWRLFIMLPG